MKDIMKNYKNTLLFGFMLSLASFNLVAMEDGYETPDDQPIGNHQFVTPNAAAIIHANNIPGTPEALDNQAQVPTSQRVRRNLLEEFDAVADREKPKKINRCLLAEFNKSN